MSDGRGKGVGGAGKYTFVLMLMDQSGEEKMSFNRKKKSSDEGHPTHLAAASNPPYLELLQLRTRLPLDRTRLSQRTVFK